MTAGRTAGRVFPICLYLSGDLLFLFFRILGAGWELGVHAIHHLDELLPCVCSVNHVLGLEDNHIVLDSRFQQIT